MSLFQTQVERQFLAGITTNLTPIYQKYLAYFGNPDIQSNILQVSEEQYQGEFIRALFVDILGYTAQPQPNFNLLREKKNETDAKSADAAISINNQIVGVIELKDHKTQDLKKVEVQAFGYKNNHKNCHYVVTSNFERLRFYIDNAVDFIEFDLFNLTFDEFRRLWLCLSYESIAKNLPQEIKNQSLSNEDIITKKLYKDYSVFKRLLFDNIVLLNPEHDKLLLFKETQKLLDRFLFLFFAEDKSLLPANSIQGTVDKWKKFNSDPMNDYQSLYSRFVKYFKLLDVGYKDAYTEIYAYNGGLFANDEFLNKLRIDDSILSENVLKLAQYDYDTDVDVNILGHIFENSLNEIEEVTNEINTGVKTTSKRKQDGVFYTPRYITQYIVENTVGRHCEEKKAELGIGEELFEYKRADKKKQALKVFDAYREWLLQITIVDPACGSGAFLNTALDFLIAEHKWIDNQQDKIAGLKDHFSMGLSNIENTILENNLFGVDINEESVEIAKLSLWLRTAKPHRKLSSLNNNIKCGNSLIDDPAVAGDKAFDWHKEFPQVFGREQKPSEVITLEKTETPDYLKLIKDKSAEAQTKAEQGIALSQEALEISKQLTEYAEKLMAVSAPKPKYEKLKGGFDVVIGNPPYVDIKALPNELVIELFKKYPTAENRINLYSIFIEKGVSILKENGILSFINPNSMLINSSYQKLRNLISDGLQEIVKLPDDVFPDAKVETIIFFYRHKIRIEDVELILFNRKEKILSINQSLKIPINKAEWKTPTGIIFSIYTDENSQSILSKVENNNVLLNEIAEFSLGITPYDKYRGHSKEIIDKRAFHSKTKIDETCKPLITGENITRFLTLQHINEYIKYGTWLGAMRDERFFTQPRILIRQIVSGNPPRIYASFCDSELYFTQIGFGIIPNNQIDVKYLLCLLNSTLLNFYHKYKFLDIEKDLFQKILIANCKQLPIKYIGINQQPFIVKADQMLTLNKGLLESSQKFQRMLQRKFELEELPGKLQNWYLLSYKEFIAELGKKKVKLTLTQEAEWEDYFNMEKAKALEIKKQIDDTDREIDRMVYALYELTEEEVKIVEEIQL